MMRFLRPLLAPAVRRALRSRFSPPDIHGVLDDAFNDYERQRPRLPKEKELGARLMVHFAALTAGVYRSLRARGVTDEDARRLAADMTWRVYEKMAAVPWLIARLTKATPYNAWSVLPGCSATSRSERRAATWWTSTRPPTSWPSTSAAARWPSTFRRRGCRRCASTPGATWTCRSRRSAAAERAGFKGAMFPWQSGSDGQEQTQVFNLNPRSERWVADNSHLQRHVGSAIAYNVWQYFQVTRDVEFMNFYGAELMLEIARFWSSIASLNDERGRYEIRRVVGPDEFHDAYPGSATPGLDNNAYTNIMAVWVLCRALEVLELLSDIRRSELTTRLGISADEVARWGDISRRMFVPFHDGVISQFEGYDALRELDWEDYRRRYGNIQRLDLILEAENDSANRYKLAKQADVLMLFYLFSSEELRELFDRLGYPFEYETIPRNIAYYSGRASHGSTLCRVVYSWVLARSDRPRAMDFFAQALQSDVSDIQQGTTGEGVHLGAMAGTVDLVQRVSTGIEVRSDVLHLAPELPQEMARLDMRIRYRGHSLDLRLTRDSLTIRGRDGAAPPIPLCVDGEVCEFVSGTTRVFRLKGDAKHIGDAP